MYSLTSANRYYLYQGFVRMNLGIDGLFKIIRSQMKELSPNFRRYIFILWQKPAECKILRWMVMAFSCTTSVWKVEVLSCRHLTPYTGNYEISYQVLSFILNGCVIEVCTVAKRLGLM